MIPISALVPESHRAAWRRPAQVAPLRRPSASSRGTAPGSRRARGPLAVDFRVLLLAQANRLRCDLDQPVVAEFQRLLVGSLDHCVESLVVVSHPQQQNGRACGGEKWGQEVTYPG